MLDLWRLRCFVAAAETQHIGRAAELLNLSPSPLSRQIREMEEQLGVELFARVGRRIQLTTAGQHFLNQAKALLVHAEQVERTGRDLGAPNAGPIAIGHIQEAMYSGVLPHLMRTLERQHPLLRPHLYSMSSNEQLQALTRGEIDIAFVNGPLDTGGYSSLVLFDDPLVAVLASNHRLAASDKVDLRSLASETWIGPPFEIWQALKDSFVKVGAVPVQTHKTTDIVTSLSLVAAGLGFTIAQAGLTPLLGTSLALRPITSLTLTVTLVAVWRDEALSQAALTVLGLTKALAVPRI